MCRTRESVKSQKAVTNTVKENIPKSHLTIQMDFSENFICNSVDDFQSTYWNLAAVTYHPVVVHFNDSSSKRKHSNFVYVSDDLCHKFGIVYSFTKDFIYVHYRIPVKKSEVYSPKKQHNFETN